MGALASARAEETPLSEKTDFEVIRLVLTEDPDYFEELVRRYKNLVYGVALRMTGDREEAGDISQEVFIKVYRNLAKYYPEYKLSTWIMRIASNHVIDFKRRQKAALLPLDESLAMAEESGFSQPEAALLAKEERTGLNKLLAALPDMYKIPILLYHKNGLSYQEIAQITDEPLSKVKNRIFRGRKILKEQILKEREGR
ncbi:MAG: sigma-70 family RNA polymerase sigma factor [Clostridiales bacterium]|jgi:RNA polymerase sigma-70 factor (ECF subfamily)|nr:sigma-70 family RNA polymerase sigma factor [Clostridiales bacterium]